MRAGKAIYKLTDRMEVNVHSEHRLTLNCMEYRTFTDTSEDVVFTTTWTCAKGEREWKSWGFHCKVQNRILTENLVSVHRDNLSWADQTSLPCANQKSISSNLVIVIIIAWEVNHLPIAS